MDLERLAFTAEKECGLDRARPVLVGVSGGPDSLCLAHSLHRLGFPVVVAHFDHQLRVESKADSTCVEAFASRFGLPFYLGSQNVAAYARENHLSLEEAARELRYRYLFSLARELPVQAVAVGHTADDQVETVLMHLLRGAGLAGLRGMAYRSIHREWDGTIPLVRPLLPFWRADTVAYCREEGLDPVQDASNLDTTFLRNRLRRELIPYLETYNPQVRGALWRMSQALAADEAAAQQCLDRAWRDCFVTQEGGRVFLKLEELRALSPGVARGILRRAVSLLLPTLRDVDFNAIDRALVFLVRPSSAQVDLARGLRVFQENHCLVLSQASASPGNASWPQIDCEHEVELEIPAVASLPGGWRLASQWMEGDALPAIDELRARGPWEAWLDAALIQGKLRIRRPRRGDRFEPLGMGGHSLKLSDFWIDHQQPRRARAAWPLLVMEDRILWIPGFRIAEPFRLQKNTRKALYLRLFRVNDEDDPEWA